MMQKSCKFVKIDFIQFIDFNDFMVLLILPLIIGRLILQLTARRNAKYHIVDGTIK